MNKPIIWSQVIIGLLALAVGVVLYIWDRPASQTYFVPEAISQYDKGVVWFGVIGNYLPTFVHAFALCLITIGVLGGGRRVALKVCLFWLFIDGFFEIGQHDEIAKIIVPHIPNWFAHVPVLENTASYFSNGHFDPIDMLSIILGVSLAFALIGRQALSR